TELSASILEDVAVVPQKAVLVQGTIRDNILYGTDDILPDDELFCILNSLGLIKEDCGEHFLAFLDRDINPLGSGLSGGEIQRLCIARALARKKKIIVLDEPTASIGEELAIKIITYIRQHCPTVIITTHNPRILELADHFLMVCQSLASLLEKAETNKPHTLIHLYLIGVVRRKRRNFRYSEFVDF
ncbi:ATP-binding cassette domain-containing protein, partial [Escherichia coli]